MRKTTEEEEDRTVRAVERMCATIVASLETMRETAKLQRNREGGEEGDRRDGRAEPRQEEQERNHSD